jgi:large subunit ribosomal protein L18
MPTKKTSSFRARARRVRSAIRGVLPRRLKEARPRLSVARSLRHISAQIIDDAAGKTLAAASDLKISKGKKAERAAEVGKALAEAAKKAGVSKVVFDRGGRRFHGRIAALAEAARAGGLEF